MFRASPLAGSRRLNVNHIMSYTKRWRDSASLILLSRANAARSEALSVNYDILLQTRTRSASFPNSVVFPGGVIEEADADGWRRHLTSFGFEPRDFDSLHRAGTPVTPIFKDNPVQRHLALRITAIRETFEELGLLICSRDHKKDRSGNWASVLLDIDVKHWQERVSKDPGQLLNLCKEYNCYPDIWSLHYWSNWLSPVRLPKRFSTAFFVAAVECKPGELANNSEVKQVEWSCPEEVLHRPEVVVYPPQVYELKRLSHFRELDRLIAFAKERSDCGTELLFPVLVKAKDGVLHLLPGDDLYPASVDYCDPTLKILNQTLSELRENCVTLHRFENPDNRTPAFIFQNHKPNNHINMGNIAVAAKVTVH